MGSVIGYDALCRSPDSHLPHDASRHSTPEHVQKKSDNGILKYIFIFILKVILIIVYTGIPDDCTSVASMDSSFKVLVTPPVRRRSSSTRYFIIKEIVSFV